MGVLVAVLLMMLLGALGGAMTIIATGETRIVANHRAAAAAEHAAVAGVEIVLNHLATVPDWLPVHSGVLPSSFVDGPSSGVRETASGRIDIARETELVRRGPPPRAWQVYAHAPLRDLAAVSTGFQDLYVIVWAAAHPGGSPGNTVLLLAHAYGTNGIRGAIEANVARSPGGGVHVTSWRQVR